MELCPHCGSSASVHSVSELAAIARTQLGEAPYGTVGGLQPGYQPGSQSGPVPGWAAEPQPGPISRQRQQSARTAGFDYGPQPGLDEAVAGAVLGAAARFIGRAAGRRAQRTVSERAIPALAARAEATAREQIAVAEKYPGLRACLDDGVIFLAGGNRVLPMPDLSAITVAQADALVAQLAAG
jgi:hypothetical protein